MIQEKLRTLRKQKGFSQGQMAKTLSTDTSNYSRKERGEVKIHDEEWQKLSEVLEIPLKDLKEDDSKFSIKNEYSTFNDSSINDNQFYKIPISIVESLQDYISILKREN